MENRIGKINISNTMIDTNINEVADILSILKFVPIRVENMYTGITEMIGYSHMFKVIDIGLCAIEYTLHITKKEDDTITVEVKGA